MFRRLYCHYCGTRSQYPRGTRQFQCPNCEALNFFDANGEVAEPPSSLTNATQPQSRIRATPPPVRHSSPPSQEQIFCQRCLNNQRMYMDALNSYLPDEDHPRYQEYIDKLPQKKEELERKYPQVCKKCAPKAQQRIYQADYYGMSQQVATAVNKTRARRGQSPVGVNRSRDDWRKWCMRLLFDSIRIAVYGSLLVQSCWHAYSIGMQILAPSTGNELIAMPLMFEPSHRECFKQSLQLQLEPACSKLLGRDVLIALASSLLLIWYNPGLKAWYHPIYRVEEVHGQAEYFRLQVFTLLVRITAWYNLRNSEVTVQLSTQQLVASHGFMIAFMVFAQLFSERCIKLEKWRIRGRIMPRPSEQDVFSETAGPANEQYARQASSTHPLSLFSRDQNPFPIAKLAPQSRPTRGYSKLDLPGMPPPSPPGTESASEDDYGDAMDIDTPPARTSGMPGAPVDRTFRPKTHKSKRQQLLNPGATQASGFGAMLGEVFGMENQLREADERKRRAEEERTKQLFQPQREQSPFRGRLPQTPMSVGRRLRNPPPSQVQFKPAPASKQLDFMKQMRRGFENGRVFPRDSQSKATAAYGSRNGEVYDDDEGEISPAKNRTRGTLDLKPSSWHLPSDVQTTGLEDLMGGKSFAIADEAPLSAPLEKDADLQRSTTFSWTLPIIVMVLAVLFAALNVKAVRRPLSLWLLHRLEEMGV